MLNYGYAPLEAECLRVINSVELDAHVGFLHEMQPGKSSLAYDLQELFRFVVDLAILNLIETDAMEKKDFVRTESYSLRLRPTGAQKATLGWGRHILLLPWEWQPFTPEWRSISSMRPA